jgi:hypothetical protein
MINQNEVNLVNDQQNMLENQQQKIKNVYLSVLNTSNGKEVICDILSFADSDKHRSLFHALLDNICSIYPLLAEYYYKRKGEKVATYYKNLLNSN